jgi:RHS repeat-associated protein
MKIKAFYKKENLFLQSPMSGVKCPESIFWWKPLPTSPERRGVLCLMSNVQCPESVSFDYMHFRYYSSTMGRFLKPDNIIPNAANPQGWNLYSYVNGNPVNFNDPSGHDLRGKQGKMGMHQALMGVPNVDISGMLTAVEIYEWFSGNILYDNVPTAAEYFRNQSIASTPRPSNGFQFSSPYGYTAGVLDQTVIILEPAKAEPCSNEACIEEREMFVQTIKWELSLNFQFYYPDIYPRFLAFEIHYENSVLSPSNRVAGGWINCETFTNAKVGALSFDLSAPSPWIAYSEIKFFYTNFQNIHDEVAHTILHEFAHYYLRTPCNAEMPAINLSREWFLRFFRGGN